MSSTYTALDVERLLQAHFNGVAFRETTVPEGMPKAATNKATTGTDWAEAVDLKNALAEAGYLVNLPLLKMRYGDERETAEISSSHGVDYAEVALKIYEDVRILRDLMNGKRPPFPGL